MCRDLSWSQKKVTQYAFKKNKYNQLISVYLVLLIKGVKKKRNLIESMKMDLTIENDENNSSEENLSSNRYLKTHVPLSRQNACRVPLGLRRSISCEDKINENYSDKSNNSNILFGNNSLSSSLNNLCFRLKPYQLLPEFNKYIEKSDTEHQFDWWNTIDHLRPLIENIILDEKLINHFQDDTNKEDQNFILFQKSKRNKRRNGICFAIDKLFYNQQMSLFVAITREIQIQFNLMSSGFKI
jgi:hypothetical protein